MIFWLAALTILGLQGSSGMKLHPGKQQRGANNSRHTIHLVPNAWVVGDGIGLGGVEKFIGSAKSYSHCIELVKAGCPLANGATVAKGGVGNCYCETGMTGANSNQHYETILTTYLGTANGDPHIVNLRGERFDILRRGWHTLMQIPQGADPQHTLLRVEANVVGGKLCNVSFIKELNFSGKWVETKKPNGMSFHIYPRKASEKPSRIFHAGPIRAKITYGLMKSGVTYLNFRALDLAKVNLPIGGLLGLDDHAYATSIENCTVDPDYMNMTEAEELEAGDRKSVV